MTPSDAAAQQSSTPAAQSIKNLKSEQNFSLAIAAGIAAAIGGAILWAIVTVMTNSKLGLIAIAVGYLVGKAIRITGRGIDKKFGYLGAACGLLGCALGNMLSAIAFYAQLEHLDVMYVVKNMDMNFLINLMTRFSQPMDVVFYAISIYEGYRFSFKYRLVKRATASSNR